MLYRHTQWGYAAAPTTVLAVIVAAVVLATGEPVVAGTVIIALAVITFVVVWMSRLTVTVESGRIGAAFGWGWPRRTVDLDDVSSVTQIRNRWIYGWGIRAVPRGWMFNVWGLDAVELALASGRVFRIGTDEPEELLATLNVLRKG